ncbi:adenosylcobinamide-phosphate synthase [Rhodovulum imhoffii]|uniref:Cobalamin biosynthesis protein CobD n=1 Tax=Rhodovulum imhoffii TaxID=365340 RepID=A0A2T5BVF7_9RHOB|nr:adenosylcobinamide-phosphate synthase CbiB [Rhodovulum imhoffii]MBK5934192.1 cobalamin biosynthesis protein CobD [Rhodovulum imhoffii]PTN03561.1 adenosylcobinamide-phosphate synthase [Rhodovulum imhoffii]
MNSLALLIALGLETAFGWPDRLHTRISHPVMWLGLLIDALESRWNTGSPQRRLAKGAACTAVTVAAATLPAAAVAAVLPDGAVGAILTGLLAAPLVAPRSMYTHVAAVARPLSRGDLAAARQAVTMIVGRNPAHLDAPAITRAALESLAENTSDGVVAPVFWGVFLGLPGIAGYKAINTLDSMIGHRSTRFMHFGRVAARLDDVANWVPARLTGGLFCLAGAAPRNVWKVMKRDARKHRSPNAGWPEAAMAGGLGVRLSGPRCYDETLDDDPWLNETAPDPAPETLWQGLGLYLRAVAGLALGLAGLALAGL